MRKRYWVLIVMLVGGAGLLVASVATDRAAQDDDETDEAVEEVATVPVAVEEPTRESMTDMRSYSATVEAWEQAHVSGLNGTLIDAINVREGDRVERGQLIAEMYDSDLRQARIEERTARAEYERTKRLVEVGSVAGQQLEQVEAQYETAQSTVEMLDKNTRLTAPIDGVVTARYFVAGEQFVSSAEAPTMVTIQQLDPLKVTIDISERYFRVVDAGMEARVRLDAHPDKSFDAVVDRVHPMVSPDSRTFRTELQIDNPDRELVPGMSGRVQMKMGEVDGQFVPRSTVHRRRGTDGRYLWIVDGDDRARRVDVELGERAGAYQRIVDGLEDDARVVVEGAARLTDGTAVRITD